MYFSHTQIYWTFSAIQSFHINDLKERIPKQIRNTHIWKYPVDNFQKLLQTVFPENCDVIQMNISYHCLHFRLHERSESSTFHMDTPSLFVIALPVCYKSWPGQIDTAITVIRFHFLSVAYEAWHNSNGIANPFAFADALLRNLSVVHSKQKSVLGWEETTARACIWKWSPSQSNAFSSALRSPRYSWFYIG